MVAMKLKEIYNTIIKEAEPSKYTLYCDLTNIKSVLRKYGLKHELMWIKYLNPMYSTYGQVNIYNTQTVKN